MADGFDMVDWEDAQRRAYIAGEPPDHTFDRCISRGGCIYHCRSGERRKYQDAQIRTYTAGLQHWQGESQTFDWHESLKYFIGGLSTYHWDGEKGRNMKVSRRTVVRKQLERLEQELTKLERFPEDTFEDGTIIQFDKLFNISWETYERLPENKERVTVYRYAAIKSNDKWYTTGNRAYDWDELTAWMGDGVKEIWVMTPTREILGGSGVAKQDTSD